jgi:hypothetical protein
MSHLELIIVAHVRELLRTAAGSEHTVEAWETHEGISVVVKRVGSKSWRVDDRFLVTWRDALRFFSGVDDTVGLDMVEEVKRRMESGT